MSKRSRKSQSSPPPTSPAPAFTVPGDTPVPIVWIGAVIFLLALVAYWPALTGGFIWDDAGHVTRADLRSLDGLGRIWFELGATQQYYPLLHSVFWLEHHLWGEAAVGYHLVNVLWHSIAACLFGVLLQRIAFPGAWLAAFIFALHPVCVESVAWIAEQKNTLSLVFYLCAALAYLRFDTTRSGARYAVATAWFVAALLTKTVTASLPAALLVVQWWRQGRLTRRDIFPLLPWFALSAGAATLTSHFERTMIGANGPDFAFSFAERCLIAGRVFWFYLGKLCWPANLIFMYPHWNVSTSVAWQWLFPIALLALVAGLWFTKRRGLLAATLLFLGSLFPALGFVNVYPFLFSFVADHFQYLASLALFATAAHGIVTYASRFSVPAARAGYACLLLVLGLLTWRQSTTYQDKFTLYESTLAKNPDSWMAHHNLATALTESGRPEEAVPHLEKALKLRPNIPEAESNLGEDFRVLNRPLEALPHFETALRLQPDFAEARDGYGMALMASGRAADGIAQFEETIRRHPKFAMPRLNLGLALAQSGRLEEAVKQFEAAAQIQPDYAGAELQWGAALLLLGRPTEATPHFEKAFKLEPKSPDFHHTYARALAEVGRFNDAIAQEEQALALNPDYAEAHRFLARMLQQTGRLEEARRHLEAVQQLGGK